jgi:PPOX class probable F420-dependent enzyme
MPELTEKQREFLQNPYVGVVTTLRADGSAHSTVVWVTAENGYLGFNTARGRLKDKNLRDDPRVTLTVLDPADAYRWVSITGRADVTEEGADDEIDRLSKKYLGKDEYPWRDPAQQRLRVKITPEKIEGHGLDD